MNKQRIGHILSHLVPLSAHDVEEILSEQRITRRRFGEAALALGLVRPTDIWQAWIEQIDGANATIDLEQIGIDAQAAGMIDPITSQTYGIVAVRCRGNDLLVASVEPLDDAALTHIASITGRRLVCATASAEGIKAAQQAVYGATAATVHGAVLADQILPPAAPNSSPAAVAAAA